MSNGINTVGDLDVGKLFTTTGTDVWRVECFEVKPTATLVNVESGERRTGELGGQVLAPFIPLVPSEAVPNA